MSKYINLNAAIRILWELSMPLCDYESGIKQLESLPTIEVSEDAISREQFREQMYHRCFEVDNDPNIQKWESGNWIRWKLFEEELEQAPSVIPKTQIETQNSNLTFGKDTPQTEDAYAYDEDDWYDKTERSE